MNISEIAALKKACDEIESHEIGSNQKLVCMQSVHAIDPELCCLVMSDGVQGFKKEVSRMISESGFTVGQVDEIALDITLYENGISS